MMSDTDKAIISARDILQHRIAEQEILKQAARCYDRGWLDGFIIGVTLSVVLYLLFTF